MFQVNYITHFYKVIYIEYAGDPWYSLVLKIINRAFLALLRRCFVALLRRSFVAPARSRSSHYLFQHFIVHRIINRYITIEKLSKSIQWRAYCQKAISSRQPSDHQIGGKSTLNKQLRIFPKVPVPRILKVLHIIELSCFICRTCLLAVSLLAKRVVLLLSVVFTLMEVTTASYLVYFINRKLCLARSVVLCNILLSVTNMFGVANKHTSTFRISNTLDS